MKNKIKIVIAGLACAGFFLCSQNVYASRAQGTDLSRYQGYTAVKGQASDEFAISQIGGINTGGIYTQATYQSQVASGIAQGLRMHTYIWYQVGGDKQAAKQCMDYFLPRVQTPKRSIVALDYEDGASCDQSANTDAILYGMNRIKQAGYTPVYYSYKPYTLAHVDYKRILAEFPNSLWIAAYKDYKITTTPDYAYFPTMDGVAQWQFTSMYRSGGLDGNVDLLGITQNGYRKGDAAKPVSKPSAVKQGIKADNTPKTDIKAGYTVKVNFSASKWASGQYIPSWVHGKAYRVQQVSGDRVLLAGIMSWINRADVEILQTSAQAKQTSGSTYTVQSGDSWWSIATRHGMSMYTLAARNGKTIYSMLHPGDKLAISGQMLRTYTVRRGDTLSSIASRLGVSVSSLASRNHISNINWIYPGQRLTI
ncbi:LysM peptidoglycan-binding domain-containing protein [Ligilactobacillus ruminis]|uniref:LysM peptidoglycan-binding domain-containing protein n=1 Tax=Ligilactobacillus ruminis TaxID=1623 RepID=UPI0022E36713|nr:LysM peptidoglycan-binding domain-containing protein [Ligilactobacillus ruminis]